MGYYVYAVFVRDNTSCIVIHYTPIECNLLLYTCIEASNVSLAGVQIFWGECLAHSHNMQERHEHGDYHCDISWIGKNIESPLGINTISVLLMIKALSLQAIHSHTRDLYLYDMP